MNIGYYYHWEWIIEKKNKKNMTYLKIYRIKTE